MNDIKFNKEIQEIPIIDLVDFSNHPFHVLKDDELMQVVQSIQNNGVINPCIGREIDGKIQLVSGHRRKLACELLGLETIPVIVRSMTDDEAVIAMVDSNLQREHVLLSEKAYAYKMKMDALKHQGKGTSRQVVGKLETADIIGQDTDESGRQIQRYIRLTNLIPQLLDKVDNKQIAFSPAVELSYLKENEQIKLLDSLALNDCTPSHAQAIRLKKLSQENNLTNDMLDQILSETKPNQVEQYKFKKDDIRKFFPKTFSDKQIYDDVFKALDLLKKQRDRNRGER